MPNAKHVSYLQASALLGCYAAYVVAVYRSFGTVYRSHLQKSSSFDSDVRSQLDFTTNAQICSRYKAIDKIYACIEVETTEDSTSAQIHCTTKAYTFFLLDR
jgi:hypothetical protein